MWIWGQEHGTTFLHLPPSPINIDRTVSASVHEGLTAIEVLLGVFWAFGCYQSEHPLFVQGIKGKQEHNAYRSGKHPTKLDKTNFQCKIITGKLQNKQFPELTQDWGLCD